MLTKIVLLLTALLLAFILSAIGDAFYTRVIAHQCPNMFVTSGNTYSRC